MRSCQGIWAHIGMSDLIKTNRKKIAVVSGQLYSKYPPSPLSKDGLREKKTKTLKWRV